MIDVRHVRLIPYILLAVALAGSVSAISAAWRAHRPHAAASARRLPEPAPITVCITRASLCPVAAMPRGEPCWCSDPVRGTVLGHAEWVGRDPVRPFTGDWDKRDGQGPSYVWD